MKPKKIPVGISKTNVNRLKFHTHSVDRVFELEGIKWAYPRGNHFFHPTTGEEVALGDVEFVPKQRVQVEVAKPKEKGGNGAAEPEQTSP